MLEKQIVHILDQLQKQTPEAIAACSRAIYWSCLTDMIATAVPLLVLVVIGVVWIKPLVKIAIQEEIDNRKLDWRDEKLGWAPYRMVAVVTFAFAALISFGLFVGTWCNSLYWMGLFDQKAYIASQLLTKISGQ